MRQKISIIVPCYNEEESIPVFYEKTSKILGEMDVDYEICFVNDGSGDGTQRILTELSEKNEKIKYISFSRNFGKEAALYAGFCNVSGDYVAVMDADLQDPPDLLPEMLALLRTDQYDCVAARRADRNGEPPVRSWFAKKFYTLISKISDTEIVDGARDFRLMKREMADVIVAMGERNRFSKGIFGWIGFRTYWLSYENVERSAGTTKWNFWGLFKYAIDGIINFSEVPLSMASWMGIAITGMDFLFLVFIVVRKLLFGDPVDGWASTICIIGFIGGIQLFCMGIMGQYIAKTYTETKKRPHYIISDSNMEVEKIK